MHYTYKLNEKDFKEAAFKSFHVLKRLQRNRILFSVLYSLVTFIIVPITGAITSTPLTTRITMALISYLSVVIVVYFWAYPQRLFNTDRKRRQNPRKWTVKEEVSLFEDKLIHNSEHIKRTIYWKDIVESYETDHNLILYLDSKNLDFIVIKKPNQPSKDENTIQFFYMLQDKVNNL